MRKFLIGELFGRDRFRIPLGKTIRKVVYLEGEKHYLLVGLQSYKKAHGTDVRRKSKEEIK